MEQFGVPSNEIARWAGLTSAIFSICQAFTGLIWGAASDAYGRKPVILLGLFNTMCTMLLWGFSTSLPMAMTARALQGLGNGNVGILRTTVAELCPWKELQPRAFSVMPLVYTVGAIVGPTLGGALSNPLRIDPRAPRGDRLLERFPYCLPNLVAAVFFAVGILVGWLFLQETLESRKQHRDLGLRTGARLTAFVRRLCGLGGKGELDASERAPLLGQQKVVNASGLGGADVAVKKPEKPKIRDVLTYQTTLNLVVYTLLALYSIAYDQLIPVFLHHPPQDPNDPAVSLPFKFAGGFGIDSRRIGAIFTFFAVASTLFQFLLFPPLARSLGVLTCLRTAFLLYPLIFLLTPFVTLIPDPTAKQAAMIALLVVRGLAGTFAFPTSTILLTNSAASLRVLGTINGVATSVSAIGRASGPAIGGGLFTWGVKRGYVLVPFWALAGISLVAAVPTWWLVEGAGFGGDEADEADEGDESFESDESFNESDEPFTASLSAADTPRALDTHTRPRAIPDPESAFGSPAPILSYTSTRRSSAAPSLDPRSDAGEPADLEHRRSSVPIGMGKGLRRYSSNLGSTGVDASGTSWGGR
ncbi:major facilitator superfamily domain-containing protein [Boeremia exigua]|uniref:major facilitator superfamily domain-containing protein n=1 Tax=Boeremia exigua TaxID=749465 RepID=UPI001E8D156E|nr:major facilitator superfamily domain-containing protein [Boeremia exigua]KAH6639258.1 major facilitator superfamily domain-containing protein [Boeremia exigua]